MNRDLEVHLLDEHATPTVYDNVADISQALYEAIATHTLDASNANGCANLCEVGRQIRSVYFEQFGNAIEGVADEEIGQIFADLIAAEAYPGAVAVAISRRIGGIWVSSSVYCVSEIAEVIADLQSEISRIVGYPVTLTAFGDSESIRRAPHDHVLDVYLIPASDYVSGLDAVGVALVGKSLGAVVETVDEETLDAA